MVYLKRTSTNAFVAALVSAAVAVALYGALFAYVKNQNERTSALINEIEAHARQESALAQAKALIAEIAPAREKLESYALKSDGLVAFIETLESLGKGARVSLAITSVDPAPAQRSGAEYLRLGLRFEGGWRNMLRFLGFLELLPFEAHVLEMRFSRLQDKKTEDWGGTAVLRVLQRTEAR
jgi:hypothetical protein